MHATYRDQGPLWGNETCSLPPVNTRGRTATLPGQLDGVDKAELYQPDKEGSVEQDAGSARDAVSPKV